MKIWNSVYLFITFWLPLVLSNLWNASYPGLKRQYLTIHGQKLNCLMNKRLSRRVGQFKGLFTKLSDIWPYTIKYKIVWCTEFGTRGFNSLEYCFNCAWSNIKCFGEWNMKQEGLSICNIVCQTIRYLTVHDLIPTLNRLLSRIKKAIFRARGFVNLEYCLSYLNHHSLGFKGNPKL